MKLVVGAITEWSKTQQNMPVCYDFKRLLKDGMDLFQGLSFRSYVGQHWLGPFSTNGRRYQSSALVGAQEGIGYKEVGRYWVSPHVIRTV